MSENDRVGGCKMQAQPLHARTLLSRTYYLPRRVVPMLGRVRNLFADDPLDSLVLFEIHGEIRLL
jgi:hypothetical protein